MAARYDGMPWLPTVPPVVPYPLHRMPQEPVSSPVCCPSGPLHSPTGLHAFVHCPELCTTCSGAGSLQHPYVILPWDGSHGIVHKEVVAAYPEHERRDPFLEHGRRFLDEPSDQANITDHRRGKHAFEADAVLEERNSHKLPPHRKRNRHSEQHTSTRVSPQPNDEPTILSNSESKIKFEKLGGQVQSCETCNVICGSWGVLQAHFDSKRHKTRVKHLTDEARAGNHQARTRVQNLENQMKILRRHGFM